MTMPDDRLAALSPEQQQLLRRRLQEKRSNAAAALAGRSIPARTAARSRFPLSFSQQRLWFLDRLQPGSTAYNIVEGIRLGSTAGDGLPPLDLGILQRCFTEVVRRHEMLRTVFQIENGEPLQVVLPELAVPLQYVDARRLPEEEREAEAQRWADAEAATPFDLEHGPLLRVRVVQTGQLQFVVLLAMHHIISDGWSAGVLIDEMTAFYQAFVTGGTPALRPLPIQYGDYAAWQRQQLSGEALESRLSFWRQHLGQVEPLELPTDRPRPAFATGRGSSEQFTLSRELSDALVDLSRREGVTMFMLFLAAYYTLLSRYTGSETIVAGTVMAGRQREETEPLIGFFVNTLVLRGNLTGNPTFRELLARVREDSLAIHDHQDIPFEKLLEEIRPDRSGNGAPLVQAMFIVQNAKAFKETEGGYVSQKVSASNRTARFDLSLGLEEKETWCGSIDYATDLFDAATIVRTIAHFQQLLTSVVADPDAPVAELEILPAAERQQVLEGWNATSLELPAASSMHELFEAQVARTPDAVAAVHGDRLLTYAQLNARANRLAHHLRTLGVSPDQRVGICVERGLEMVVSMLAVLKAGGAYVPLDPNYPVDRLRYILDDSAPVALLTQDSLRGLFSGTEVPAIDVDQLPEGPETNLDRGTLTPAHMAYVIYTSGSTGKPKGVVIEHRNAVNFIAWSHRSFPSEVLERTLFATSLNFDLAMYECFVPLTCGASVRIVRDALELPRTPGDVTLVNTVPSAMTALVDVDGVPDGVRTVNLAGEPLRRDLVERIFANTAVQTLCNLYGPSETTTYSTWVAMNRQDGFVAHIGRPVANTQVYILDARRQPVPIGVTGELYIGGAGVARGYLNRPELTAERFVDDPFAAESGARMYKTGDLGRWLPDGNIDFLGRNDFQVKIRGYRIELGEIEARLTSHPAVREAVVIAREDQAGDKRLVGYYRGDEINAEALRAHLAETLPLFMLPAAFVRMEALPLTPNGKIDRKALPEPERAGDEAAAAPLQGPAEELLAGIWCQLLSLEQVSADANFFEAGGHSLLATRLVSRIEELFGVQIALREVFEHPTLRALAAAIEEARRGGAADGMPMVRRDADQAALSFGQQRLWFLEQLGAGGAAYNIPIALRIAGPLDVSALEGAVRTILQRHEVLRSAIELVDGVPVQVVRTLRGWSLPVTPGRAEEIEALAREEASAPFDLTQPPLMRARLISFSEDDHLFLLTVHHIAADGWSIGVLTEELICLYLGRTLPELPVQYADYSAWQREWLAGEELSRQLEYWRSELGSVEPAHLPIDFARPAMPSDRGGVVQRHLPAAVSSAVSRLAQREGCTLYIAMLAAYHILLARLSGAEEVLVGSPIAGRTRKETEPLIGFFVNTLVLRGDLRGDPTLRELMARVRESALGAFAHQDLPFEKLVETLRPERTLGQSPLFEAMFVLQNAVAAPPLTVPGLDLRPVAGDGQAPAKFPLTLTAGVTEEGELSLLLEYQRDLFAATSAERMLEMFSRVLEAMIAAPEQRVSEVELLTADERKVIVHDWNANEAEIPALTVDEMIVAQAELQPDAPAVSFEGTTLSYAELVERAGALAGELRERGAGSERLVAVMLGRSIDLVIAQLAILMTGAAYLPIDPAYPQDRIDFMLDDARPVLLIRDELRIETGVAGLSESTPAQTADRSSQLAYVIYTSGSTGRPKGVLVEHGGLTNLACALATIKRVDASSRVLQFASMSFDASVEEVFSTLASGACLCLARRDDLLPGKPLVELIARERISVVTLPPSVLALLDPTETPTLRTVLSAGEACNAAVVARWGALLVNAYGPTEATVCATADSHSDGLSIGRPLANVQAYILDRHRRPVPVGVAGELWIGGAGVARGYLHRPDLTAERFMANPFADGRMYRTGDRARFRADGRIEFLGRIDAQVKLRGYRIEPGEIEALLREEDGVREAVVIVRDQQLYAYVAGTPSANLRERLQQKLPSFMVPAAVVVLEAFPLSPNGKIDRKALPLPMQLQHEPVAPRTATETALVQIWEELLGRPCGVTDDFFELGGHSLLAVTLVNRVRTILGKELPLRALFEDATIERIAATLGSGRSALVRLNDRPRRQGEPVLALVHPIGGDVFAYRRLAAEAELPVMALRSLPDANDLSLEELAARYVQALRAETDGPYVLAGWSFGGVVAFEMARQLGAQAERVVLIDSWITAEVAQGAREMTLRTFLADLAASLGRVLPGDVDTIDGAVLAASAAGIAVDAEALEQQFAIFQANCRRLSDYVPQPYGGRCVVVATDERPRGWSGLVFDLETVQLEGDHYSLLTEQSGALLRLIQSSEEASLAVDVP